MILAPRSCPSRPGFATTTRIFWVVLGADMGRGRPDSMRVHDDGAGRAPRTAVAAGPGLRDLDRHLHGRAMDLAEDRVGPLRVELLRHDAVRADSGDLLGAADARALRDHHVMRQRSGPAEPDGVARLDAQRLR